MAKSEREKPAAASQRGRAPKRPGNRLGTPVSDAQREAGKANLAKGRAKREELAAKAEEEARVTAGERWAALIDGSLTVRDLDDEEIRRSSVRAKDGTISGKSRTIPSHLIQAFHQEAIRRANDKIRTAAPEAVQALLDIGTDPDVREGDRIRALMYLVDRAMGKAPETIRVEGADKFGSLLDDAFGAVDRDLDVPTE